MTSAFDFKKRPLSPGFTLIEVLMVIVLLGIVGAGILAYFVGVGSSPDEATLTQAVLLAEEKLERVIADRKANGFSSVVSEPPAALPSPFDRYTREVIVFCVNEGDLNTPSGTMPGCADSDIRAKRVLVRVSWTGGAEEAVTVLADH